MSQCKPSAPRHRLIITADDFGYSAERDGGIIECFLDGAVTGVVLLVNGEAAEQACAIARKHGIPVGLHLNLTEGYPVYKNEHTSLINSDGFLRGKFGFREALQDGKIDLCDVKKEIKAQIECFQTLMETQPTHADGHQHVQVLPGVREVFAKTLAKYGIKRTRMPIQHGLKNSNWVPKLHMDFFQQFEQQAEEAKMVFQKYNIRYPDGFFGTSTMGSHMTIGHLEQALTAAENKLYGDTTTSPLTFELMTHPGCCTSPGHGGCGGGPDDFSQSKDREYEMSVLRSSDWKKVIATHNMDLGSYKDVK
ncbi:carbohydrate deacetylase-like [Amphiura filiformis]|uniref:carbohydrate deacetylase-like n=1 Tax=Amphiura filiformis TaxID=82378 RepID=UPI003B225C4D